MAYAKSSRPIPIGSPAISHHRRATNSGIEGGCNGTIRFDVVTHGVAAHSARAWMGENAIHKAADILNRLNAYEPATVNVDGLDYREGLNATLISGGKGTNVIPDECRVHVNYRFAPDKSLAEAKALMMARTPVPNSAMASMWLPAACSRATASK